MDIKGNITKLLGASRPWLIGILLAAAIEYFVQGESHEWSKDDLILAVGIAFAIGLAIRWYRALRQTSRTIPDEYCAPASQDQTVRVVITQLRIRAGALRLAARFTLFLMLIALVFGLYIFGFAEQAASRAQASFATALRGELAFARKDFDAARRDLSYESDPQKKKALEARADDAKAQIENLQDRISRAASGQNDTAYLASILSTKLGSVFMLLFLVQILVTLYRYNVRLASFCDARADILQLLTGGERLSIDGMLALLAPDKVDFGKTPASPIQNAIDIAKEIVSFRGK